MSVVVDLFCGAGGSSRGYADIGYEVVGVDYKYQVNYPYKYVRMDWRKGLDYWLERHEVAAIHAGPPCLSYSTITPYISERGLIADVRDALLETGLPYIIENVENALPYLRSPIKLCGSSFGLRVRRHRYFETNWDCPAVPCYHEWQDEDPIFDIYEKGKWRRSGVVALYGKGSGKAREHWASAMEIDWMNHKEIVLAIPPAYTRYIGRRLYEYATHVPQDNDRASDWQGDTAA